ncbi:MAG: hypothetical protein F6K26_55190, partial [Moorea sp. SIO2I5]|nr:hypothetical protein [Moorena sp. SIO2I5]
MRWELGAATRTTLAKRPRYANGHATRRSRYANASTDRILNSSVSFRFPI